MGSGVPRKKKYIKAAIDLLWQKTNAKFTAQSWPPGLPPCIGSVLPSLQSAEDPITGEVPQKIQTQSMNTLWTYLLYHLRGYQWQCMTGDLQDMEPCEGVSDGYVPPYELNVAGYDFSDIKKEGQFGPQGVIQSGYCFRDKAWNPRNEKLQFFKTFSDPLMKGEAPDVPFPCGAEGTMTPTPCSVKNIWDIPHYILGAYTDANNYPGNSALFNTASLTLKNGFNANGPPYYGAQQTARGRGVLYTNDGPHTSYIPCLHTIPGTSSIQIPEYWTGSIAYDGYKEEYRTHTQSLVLGVYGSIGKGDTLNFYSGGTDGFDTKFFSFGPSEHYLAGANFWPDQPGYGPPNTYNYYRDFVCVPTGNLPIQIVLTQSAIDTVPKAGLMICWAGYDKTSL